MAKTFGNLKSNKLDMLDKLTMGKFAGCRICDIIADDFEYLIWLNKQGFVNFTTEIDSYGETIISDYIIDKYPDYKLVNTSKIRTSEFCSKK